MYVSHKLGKNHWKSLEILCARGLEYCIFTVLFVASLFILAD